MEHKTQKDMAALIDSAVSGDRQSLEALLTDVQDLIFNLSLRMLGTIPDAEDATQEILIKIMTCLASFRRESSFTTWAFRIAVNHLKDYRKGMFCKHPLSFEVYGEDITSGREKDMPDLSGGVDRGILEQELKLSCTNVMLQCLDRESRCIFILGTMFRADSRIAGDILGISPGTYRQRLSRIRKKVADFMDEYCGLSGKGQCSCKRRIDYAIATRRLNPSSQDYLSLERKDQIIGRFINTMDEIDGLSLVFTSLPVYRATEQARRFLTEFLNSERFSTVADAQAE